uniref:WAT1-related protein n=1 Tax=Nicotiana sylvestris TaxID=4096 RepID=A0A1U7W0R3_NICSY|nr:PREDICTED: uncharacterized protein LOC104223808 [Nicotiana sylvestris]
MAPPKSEDSSKQSKICLGRGTSVGQRNPCGDEVVAISSGGACAAPPNSLLILAPKGPQTESNLTAKSQGIFVHGGHDPTTRWDNHGSHPLPSKTSATKLGMTTTCQHNHGRQSGPAGIIGQLLDGTTGRKNVASKLTGRIICVLFISALLGGTLTQYFFLLGLEYTSATFSCAFLNMVPVITFIMALLLRQETIKLKSRCGRAKILGILFCLGGALILTLYKGMTLINPSA